VKNDTMKAAVYERYGPPEVVRVAVIPKPTPGRRELLVRVHATTVSSADSRLRRLTLPRGFGLIGRLMFGMRRPRLAVLGTELSGVVEATGSEVTGFRVGDAVFASSGAKLGGHAEYCCVPANGSVALKPANVSFERAAALCFSGITALVFLRRAQLKTGERVLVNGASGAVGSAVVQIARHLGADVTGVTSTHNVPLVRSLGANRVIDYTQQDFTTLDECYDVLVDTVGTAPYRRSRQVLADGGRLLLVLGDLLDLLSAPWYTLTSHHKVIAGPVGESAEDARRLAELAASGAYKPLIDRRYGLDDIVEAHRHVDTGHKRGNVVIRVNDGHVHA
jgi:NADPH:quinone reductase-like Zn-dependent oxidoreductase